MPQRAGGRAGVELPTSQPVFWLLKQATGLLLQAATKRPDSQVLKGGKTRTDSIGWSIGKRAEQRPAATPPPIKP